MTAGIHISVTIKVGTQICHSERCKVLLTGLQTQCIIHLHRRPLSKSSVNSWVLDDMLYHQMLMYEMLGDKTVTHLLPGCGELKAHKAFRISC